MGSRIKLAFLSITPMAAMPWRTMAVCRPYCEMAEDIVQRNSYGDARVFPYRYRFDSDNAKDVMEKADVFIVTSYMSDNTWHINKYGKPIARHYSTEPFRWVERDPKPENSHVVAQYQARFAPKLDVLPNCIPIDNPMFKPEKKPNDRVVIVYTPTNRGNNQWATKGFAPTIDALRKIKSRYNNNVEIVVLEKATYEEVMKARRYAHICIDECATGSYHSCALESLSCGCVTICWMDDATESAWYKLGLSTIPFNLCTQNQLKGSLEVLIENADFLEMQCNQSRKWVEKNYSERWQADKWIKWHESFLNRFETQSLVKN